jgi:hypothetical protein
VGLNAGEGRADRDKTSRPTASSLQESARARGFYAGVTAGDLASGFSRIDGAAFVPSG